MCSIWASFLIQWSICVIELLCFTLFNQPPKTIQLVLYSWIYIHLYMCLLFFFSKLAPRYTSMTKKKVILNLNSRLLACILYLLFYAIPLFLPIHVLFLNRCLPSILKVRCDKTCNVEYRCIYLTEFPKKKDSRKKKKFHLLAVLLTWHFFFSFNSKGREKKLFHIYALRLFFSFPPAIKNL